LAAEDIRINSVRVFPHPARLNPQFGNRPVLTPDPFAYVRLSLQRSKASDALVYWRQAEEFFLASASLSTFASPVTSYYCVLNAVKALLKVRGHQCPEHHGLSGTKENGPVSLLGENVRVVSGVFPAIVSLYGGAIAARTSLDLRELLGEMPFIHRAFTLTYKSQAERFIPLEKARFVRKSGSSEAWFQAYVPPSYSVRSPKLPSRYEKDVVAADYFVIRSRKRFRWEDLSPRESMARLAKYHERIRNDVFPVITRTSSRWYLRKPGGRGLAFKLPLVARIFAALHRFSELSRYDPVRLGRHLEAQHNWLLTEFLSLAPAQLVHIVASELSGREFLEPDSVRLPSLT